MAKEKEIKTNAMRILDRQKIKYEDLQYECDEFIDGLHTAEKTGAPVEQSFKTLVAQGKSKQYYVLVLPIAEEVDLANRGRMNMYRIIIKGVRAPELMLLPEKLKTYGYVTEVLDESRPAYDLEELEKKYSGTLIGDYISCFLEKDRSAMEEKALYYGLQALLETSR